MDLRVSPLQAAAAAVLSLVAIQACSSGPSTSSSSGATLAPLASSSVATAPPTPTASLAPPAHAAPAELQGRWNTDIAPGDQGTLIIGETSYQISRGGASGGGRISVDADSIVFSDARGCVGAVGTYTWAIDAGVLTFTVVGAPDPCPRTDVLLHPLER